MSRLVPAVLPRRRTTAAALLSALLALTAAACGRHDPTAPHAARAPRFDTVSKDTTQRAGSYENPGV